MAMRLPFWMRSSAPPESGSPPCPRARAQALRWLRRHDEREYSFVDATSFALAKALRIREVLAFDGDFSAAEFVELRTETAG